MDRAGVLQLLQQHGVQHEVFEHPAVMTCEAQIKELAGVDGQVTKNLFLRDKKRRQYVVTALSDTQVNLKLLSARLGTGKGGVSWGSPEAMAAALQVEPGCVTPLAVAAPSAADVLLLLDARLRQAGAFFVHPIVNTASVRLDAAGLEAFLRGIGRELVWVDLAAEPVIDKEHPPDLKVYADALTPAPAEDKDGDGAASAAPAAAGAAAAAAAGGAAAASSGKGGKGGKAAAGAGGAGAAASSDTAKHMAATDVLARTEELIDMVAQALLGKPFGEAGLEPYVAQRLRANVESALGSVKNAAYATGFAAARDQMAAFATKRWS